MSAFLGALLRAAPLCAVLPLPGLAARAALAIALAAAGLGAIGAGGLPTEALLRELGRGVALGLGVAAPLYAARWAGGLIGRGAGPGPARASGDVAIVLGWVVFIAAGGARGLAAAYLGSYTRWPVATAPDVDVGALAALIDGGIQLVALTARLALPALCVLALVELSAGLLARFERSAALDGGATVLGRAARPVLVGVLLTASAAAFTHGVGAAVRAAVTAP